jgi:hypothetical protein
MKKGNFVPESVPTHHLENTLGATSVVPRIHHVYAMQRSGQHAVMAWLQDCYQEVGLQTEHVNDAYHGHVPGLDVVDPTAQDVLLASGPDSVTFVNYEDLPYWQRNDSAAYRELQPNAISHDVIVLRDWFNMAASRLRSIDQARDSGVPLQLHDLSWQQISRAWLDHASHVLSGGPTVLNYNQWFTDAQYRHTAAAWFGLPNSERSLDHVPSFGRGSSFDGMAYATSGRRMGVLERWNQLSPESHQRLIEVSESSTALSALNQLIFGLGLERVKQSYVERVRAA